MNSIELEVWTPSETDPRYVEYAGQRTAAEVFEELKYLPDEYFSLGREWEEGQEIPRGADVFCTTDYGGSEGIYLDVYLKWYTENGPITKSFIVGKTLGESSADLDRMFLISSAITKAFRGEHAEQVQTGGAVVHLSAEEQKTILTALMEQRERQENAMSRTEQLLRRMAGSITAYMDAVGQRPLHMSDRDRVMLAVRDGELRTFRELYPQVKDQANDLLVKTAGRPGIVGQRMMELVMKDRNDIGYDVYRAACQKAIDIHDMERVLFLTEQAQRCVPRLDPAFYGEMASYAYLENRSISREIIRQCSAEQISAAPSGLLEQYAAAQDYRTMFSLVEKGISGGESSARVLHMLTCEGGSTWTAESLLKRRMWVDTGDYGALHACIQNDAVEVAKLLLDRGMDFDLYRQWAEHRSTGHEETVQAVADYWSELQAEMKQAGPQGMGGPVLG